MNIFWFIKIKFNDWWNKKHMFSLQYSTQWEYSLNILFPFSILVILTLMLVDTTNASATIRRNYSVFPWISYLFIYLFYMTILGCIAISNLLAFWLSSFLLLK